MGKDEEKKTMRFWIITGIVAMTAFQIPMLLKKGNPKNQPKGNQMEEQQERHPGWMMLLIAIGLLGLLLWLFDYFI